MRPLFLILSFLLLTSQWVVAFEGNDDNVVRDYYVELYKTQPYVLDFENTFSNTADRHDYKKLREYLNRKKEIERVLQMAGDEFYYGLSFSRMFAEDYIESLEEDLRFRQDGDLILLRINSAMPNMHFNGEYKVSYIQSEILPAIKKKYTQSAIRDSINQVFYTRIQENLERVQYDIFLCEQALNTALSPEFQQQNFRIWISLTFSMLIAVLLCVFFFIIFRRSDKSLAKLLLNDTGLQFITIFVLIIAIILFGILNILQGSELAAILSGISGYILGKGGQAVTGKHLPENKANIQTENIGYPQSSTQAVITEPIPEEQEKEGEDKYFPGENF
ncbi:MAG: hypothetical protein LBQ22_02410 [Bacteroidales bacterium]|jgi:hypothetical protein|nr:hypothetical protein [Bacteroidales bacterium]